MAALDSVSVAVVHATTIPAALQQAGVAIVYTEVSSYAVLDSVSVAVVHATTIPAALQQAGVAAVFAPPRVDGYVLKDTLPVERTVRLHNRETGELLAETTSNSAGEYRLMLPGWSGQECQRIVLSEDFAARPDIIDRVIPE